MEISTILLQQQASAVQTFMMVVAVGSLAALLVRSVRIRVLRPRIPRPTWLGSVLGSLGLAMALSETALAMGPPRARLVRVGSSSGDPSSFEPGGSPPPLPPGSITHPHDPDVSGTIHPAIHRGNRPFAPLFPRASGPSQPLLTNTTPRIERISPMRAHPSDRENRDTEQQAERFHTVVLGDTLWDIAAATLRTTDLRRIARYWPRLHRANREIIGRDPSMLLPGQVLFLPNEHE